MLSSVCCRAERYEMFSLFWYFCIQWRCCSFCTCEASTFSRILLNIFPVSSWSELFESREIWKWPEIKSSLFAQQLQQDQRPSLVAINSQEQSNISTFNPVTRPALSWDAEQTSWGVNIQPTFHTSRKTMATSGMKSKERRLRSTTSLRALGSWSAGERNQSFWSWTDSKSKKSQHHRALGGKNKQEILSRRALFSFWNTRFKPVYLL